MKAIRFTRYGPPDVLRMEELPQPQPRAGEVRIRVRAVSLNALDWRLRAADPFLVRLMNGLWRPRKWTRPGADVAGTVEAVGSGVTRVQPGDEVVADVFSAGLGGLAEYACAREDTLAAKPTGVSFEEAATVPVAGITALQGLRDMGHLQPGQQVLVHGASGGVGTFAVQLAKAFGAEVTAVCSTRNLELVRSLGADRVVDYTREDFARSGQRFDVILGVNGYRWIGVYRRALKPGGTYVMAGGSSAQLFQALLLGPLISRTGSRRMAHVTATSNGEDLAYLLGLMEAGRLKPVIDRRFPLSEAVEAFRYLEGQHAQGKVVVTV